MSCVIISIFCKKSGCINHSCCDLGYCKFLLTCFINNEWWFDNEIGPSMNKKILFCPKNWSVLVSRLNIDALYIISCKNRIIGLERNNCLRYLSIIVYCNYFWKLWTGLRKVTYFLWEIFIFFSADWLILCIAMEKP